MGDAVAKGFVPTSQRFSNTVLATIADPGLDAGGTVRARIKRMEEQKQIRITAVDLHDQLTSPHHHAEALLFGYRMDPSVEPIIVSMDVTELPEAIDAIALN